MAELHTNQHPDQEKIIAFTDHYLAQDVVVKQIVHMNRTDKPIELVMTKQELLNSLKTEKENKKKVNSEMKFTLSDFELDETGQKVSIQASIGWNTLIRYPDADGKLVDSQMHSVSICEDVFELRDGELKKTIDNCTIELNIKNPVPAQ